MANDNALPTNPLDADTYLRSLVDTATIERLAVTDGEYPFLYGVATVKLAEANAEIARLRELLARISGDIDKARELLESIR